MGSEHDGIKARLGRNPMPETEARNPKLKPKIRNAAGPKPETRNLKQAGLEHESVA